ncbi:hypothetical protein MMC07_004089 [Pseudocyphellaria aurata]|nr:hypothetical protein [Pseudocyphellaria aurata]
MVVVADRYLQESGHGEAAVKLQRDWISDPQTLPFAQHIKTHALVVLVQKGLQYYEIEQSINQNGTRSSPSSSTFFFGPPSGRATTSPKQEASEDETVRFSPRTRKHGRDGTANGLQLDLPTAAPPAKRSRRSNGTDNANGDGRGNDSMDYEFNGNASSANTNGNGSGSGSGSGSGNGNNYPRPEAPEPTSNVNSPAEESQSQIGPDGTNMDIDDDAPAPAPEPEHHNHENQQQQQEQEQQQQQQQQQPDEEEDEEPEQHQHDHEREHEREHEPEHEHEHEQREQQEHQEEQDEQHDEPAHARMTLTLTNGQSVGVQSDQVAELGPETITLTIPDKNVLYTAWNPRDPAILATGGDALCRIWSTETSSTPESPKASKQPQYVDMYDPSDTSYVTNMAWSPDGEVIVVATRGQISQGTGTVSLWAKDGKSIDELPAAHDMVLIFRWNPSGTHLLGVTASGAGTSALIIWEVQSSQALPPIQLDHVVTDAAWSDDRRFTICGPTIVAESTMEGETINGIRNREDVDGEQKWTKIQHDAFTNTTAFAAEESAMLGVVDPSGGFQMTSAHSAEITALAFQPIRNHAVHPADSPRLLVTSSVDGSIKIWDAKKPFSTLHVLSLGRCVPAMAISFTPDGFMVAAASWNRVLIWNAETGGLPKASWRGELDKWQDQPNGVDQDSGIGEEDDGPTHSLDWDTDGRKLAYGLGSRVSVTPQ